MREVSEEFNDAVFSSHTKVIRVTDINTGEELPVTDGSVTLDMTAAIRGTADLEIRDPRWIPQDPSSILAPYNNDIQIERGIMIGGEPEMVRLGIFRVEETEVDDQGNQLTMRMSLVDRSARVIDGRFESEYPIAAGSDILTVIQTLVRDGYGSTGGGGQFQFKFNALSQPTGKAVTEQPDGDRWTAAQNLATIIGANLYFDNDGDCVLKSYPHLEDGPILTITEGGIEDSRIPPSLLSITRRWSRVDAFNKWIVVADDPDPDDAIPPFIGTAIDDDPASPTYYYGSFGHKPKQIGYPPYLAQSQEGVDQTALGTKIKELGTALSTDFTALVHPGLEPNDVVRIHRTRRNPETPSEFTVIAVEDYLIDRVVIPLGGGPMQCGARARTVR